MFSTWCRGRMRHSLQLTDARPRQGDPTGTSGLRRSFRAAAKLRLRQLRSQLRIAVMEHNLLGLGGVAGKQVPAAVDQAESF